MQRLVFVRRRVSVRPACNPVVRTVRIAVRSGAVRDGWWCGKCSGPVKTVRAYPASRLFGGPGCFAGFALPGLSPGRFLPAVVAGIICIPLAPSGAFAAREVVAQLRTVPFGDRFQFFSDFGVLRQHVAAFARIAPHVVQLLFLDTAWDHLAGMPSSPGVP